MKRNDIFKVLATMAVFGGVLLAQEQQTEAAAIGNPETFKVDKTANKKAIEEVEKEGGLANCPVPLENLTTQSPVLELPNRFRSTKKNYVINGRASLSLDYKKFQVRCNYLVPVDFNWQENGIPGYAFSQKTSNTFYFDSVQDTEKGGYGAGGYYWRQFVTQEPNGQKVYYWLSAWNRTDLVYN